MANQQVLTFVMKAVDESKDALSHVERGLDDVKDSAEKAAKEVGEVGHKLYDTAEAGGNAEQALRGASDIMVFMGEQFGVQLGPMQQWSAALADVGGGVEAVLKGGPEFIKQMGAWAAATWAQVTALYAQAAAWVAANAPLLIIIGTIALLVAGVILAIKYWDEITAKIPILGQAVDAIKAKLNEFTGWITGSFVPAVQGIYDAISKAVGDAIAFVQQHWDEIRAIIEPALQALVVIIETQVNLWKVAIETVLGVIKGIVDVFMGVFTGDWDRAWGGVKQIVDSVWNGIKGTIETVIGAIKKLAPLMKEAGSALLDAFWEGMKGIGGKLEEVIESIGKGIANGVIAIVNQAINMINDMIPDKIALTGLPDIDLPDNPIPNIPALARGGIVTRPTLALVGEAGPEAVIPLNPSSPGGMGMPSVIQYITVQGAVWHIDDLAYELKRRAH